MISTFAALNLCVCIFGISVSIRALRMGKPMLLPIYLLVYIVTNGLGLSLAFMPELNFSVFRSMYDTMVETENYIALCVSTWIFVLLCSAAIWRSTARKVINRPPIPDLPSDIALSVSVILLFVGLCLYAKFMIFGPGLTMARETSYFHYDIDAAYEFRKEFDLGIQQGQGLLMATVASFCIFPLAAFFSVLTRGSRGTVLVIGSICFLCSFLFAFVLRQKSPVLIMLLLYGLLYLHHLRGSLLKQLVSSLSDTRIVLVGSVLFFFGLTGFYQITEGETLLESLAHSLFRIFLVPVASNQAWFVVFPDIFPFRGLIGIFDTIFWSPSRAPVGVYEVAEAITGFQFSLNASMLAVAWSAEGYIGVTAISLIFCTIAFLIDQAIVRFNPHLFYPILMMTLPSLLSLTSTSFFDFIMKGGFLNQLVIVCAFYGFLGDRSKRPAKDTLVLRREARSTI